MNRIFLTVVVLTIMFTSGRGLTLTCVFCRRCLLPRIMLCQTNNIIIYQRRTISKGKLLFTEHQNSLSLKNKKVEEFFEKRGMDSYSPLVKSILQCIREKQLELNELEELAKGHVELRDIAIGDSIKIQNDLTNLEEQFFNNLISPEELDNNDVILEVSAGVGGQEAMLFSQEIFQMYQAYASFNGWEFNELTFDKTEIGGIRHASASISGHQVYRHLKYEGGVHRVQRVPQTEKSGRIHTSTSAVAILPQPNEIQIIINPQDLKIETKRAGGAGGQHVNTTESAVRITHIPSGISIDSQSQRSQIQNRQNALKSIRAKLYEKQLVEQIAKRNTARKLQVGYSSRSEKIRTYNLPSNRVTDHRISYSIHNIKGILEGENILNELIKKLIDFDRNERLLQIFSE